MKNKASNIIQIRLFEPERPKPKPIITYSSLSIHQKINYRANLCGFARIPYLSKYRYFASPLQHLGGHKHKYESLTEKYYWHYKVNSGGFNRLDTYIKNKNAQKQLFKPKQITA